MGSVSGLVQFPASTRPQSPLRRIAGRFHGWLSGGRSRSLVKNFTRNRAMVRAASVTFSGTGPLPSKPFGLTSLAHCVGVEGSVMASRLPAATKAVPLSERYRFRLLDTSTLNNDALSGRICQDIER